MADNVTFQPDTLATPPGDTVVATDEIDGVDYQKIKLVTGEDGEVENFSHSAPLPIIEIGLRDLMEQMLVQLKIMNMHLSELTHEEFQEGDIE